MRGKAVIPLLDSYAVFIFSLSSRSRERMIEKNSVSWVCTKKSRDDTRESREPMNEFKDLVFHVYLYTFCLRHFYCCFLGFGSLACVVGSWTQTESQRTHPWTRLCGALRVHDIFTPSDGDKIGWLLITCTMQIGFRGRSTQKILNNNQVRIRHGDQNKEAFREPERSIIHE